VPTSCSIARWQDRMTERDVGRRQAAVPEQDPLVVVLATGPRAGDDVAQLARDRRLGDQARVDVRAQRPEAAAAALAPVVDEDLVHIDVSDSSTALIVP
jgi:hypothetical protein